VSDIDTISYAAAVSELETILAQLERDDVDVDLLAERVQRAAALISHCRARLSAAQLQVERVVADLDA
jgi:exodeoxyribonuclease VII small subunit